MNFATGPNLAITLTSKSTLRARQRFGTIRTVCVRDLLVKPRSPTVQCCWYHKTSSAERIWVVDFRMPIRPVRCVRLDA